MSKECNEEVTRRADRWEYWSEMLELQQESGMTVSAFCEEMGVHATSFYSWRKKLTKEQPIETGPDDFVEVVLTGDEVVSRESGIYLEYQDIMIHLAAEFSKDTLGQVLSVIASSLQNAS